MIRPALYPNATNTPDIFTCEVGAHLCVGTGGQKFMFGGAGLGVAISAVEEAIGRPLLWASAQYLTFTTEGCKLTLDVIRLNEGKNATQVQVLLKEGDKTIIIVSAILGAREGYSSDQWAIAPTVPEPTDCPDANIWPPQEGKLHEELEMLLPPNGRVPGSGHMMLWVRSRQDRNPDAALLAVFADVAPSGVAAARKSLRGGNSLDNTLRIVRNVPTDWVLCDIKVDAAHNGFAHAQIHLYAEDRTLMAIGSQTVILRE